METYVVGFLGGGWDCFSSSESSAISSVRETVLPETSEENREVKKMCILFQKMVVEGGG